MSAASGGGPGAPPAPSGTGVPTDTPDSIPMLAGMYDSAIIAFALFALGATIAWKFL